MRGLIEVPLETGGSLLVEVDEDLEPVEVDEDLEPGVVRVGRAGRGRGDRATDARSLA